MDNGTVTTFWFAFVSTVTRAVTALQAIEPKSVVESNSNPAGASGHLMTALPLDCVRLNGTLKNSNASAYVSPGDTWLCAFFSTCKSYRPGGRVDINICSTLSTALVLDKTSWPLAVLYKNRFKSLMLAGPAPVLCGRNHVSVAVSVKELV